MANQKQNQNKNGNRPAPRNTTTPPTGGQSTATQTPPRPTTSAAGPRKLTPKQEAARRRAAARRRNQMIVIGLIAVVAIAAVAIILFAVNQPLKFDSLPDKQTADNAIALDSGLTATDERFTKGASTAKVTVTEYGDFQCPACESFFQTTEKQLINDYVKTGKVKFNFYIFAFLDQGRPAQESHVAAEAAFCAADQKRFWDFHDGLYSNQLPENSGKLTPDRMKQLASQLGLNKDQFNQCLDNHKYRNQVAQDYQTASAKGVNATPTLAINGQIITFNSYDDIKAAIESALAAAK